MDVCSSKLVKAANDINDEGGGFDANLPGPTNVKNIEMRKKNKNKNKNKKQKNGRLRADRYLLPTYVREKYTGRTGQVAFLTVSVALSRYQKRT